MPPPNVTGSLHLGHALTYTIQDFLIRYWELKGFKTHWQSGFDHAGIATQMLAEKDLAKEGKTKNDLTRQEFLNFIEKRKNESIESIMNQINLIGINVNWSNSRFTLDKNANEAVIKSFVQLYNDGLIYKAKKIINWDCNLQTTVSDLEVVNKEINGKIYYIKYISADNPSKYIEVATTRPETIFGDAAIAVNPNDTRYKGLVGKEFLIPIINKKIKIIQDDYVLENFGTGALKVTPAHDFNDFEIGIRHSLDQLDILDKYGYLNDNVPEEFRGLNRDKARNLVVDILSKNDLLTKEENIKQSIPYSDRSGSIIEPKITTQWFFNVSELAKKAIEAVENGEIKFFPNHWSSTYINWLKDIQPWCISRQLIWGHQIPAWYDENGNIFVAETEQNAIKLSQGNINLKRDEDVLDTWFSSSLWPFSSLGWPQNNELIEDFFPTSVLVTGFDIIFFWVARMVMMSLYFMKKIPFEKVYITPVVCDANGKKMSKTEKNTQDPLEIIKEFSSDSLRFSLIQSISSKRNIKFNKSQIELSRNFITKIQNAFNFIKLNINQSEQLATTDNNIEINSWILKKLKDATIEIDNKIENMDIPGASDIVVNFIWNYFCDWYIELSKNFINQLSVQKTLKYITISCLKILYPFIPSFVKEQEKIFEISVIENNIEPIENLINHDDIKISNLLLEIISEIRSIKGIFDINQKSCNIFIKTSNETIKNYLNTIKKITKVTIDYNDQMKSLIYIKLNDETVEIMFDQNIINSDSKSIIEKKLNKVESEINIIKSKLDNPSFLENADSEIIKEHKAKLEQNNITISKMKEILNLI